ncbi:MAG TPA: hypothetical protein VFR78_04670 [Pyrinomonadaceae bacterium]|nr:hypothetical protein [Pyrinomonadaceae bacterium]
MTIALTLAVCFPQQELIEWCKIVPFKTTRAEIEKAWGPPTSGTGYVLTYDTPDARITIWYGGVKPRDNSPCKWVLPEDAVLSFVFVPRKKPPLTEAKIDLKKFKKEKALEMVDDFYYYNSTEGLTLTTRIIDGEEVLLSIERNPDQTLRQKYCRDQ